MRSPPSWPCIYQPFPKDHITKDDVASLEGHPKPVLLASQPQAQGLDPNLPLACTATTVLLIMTLRLNVPVASIIILNVKETKWPDHISTIDALQALAIRYTKYHFFQRKKKLCVVAIAKNLLY